MGLNTFILSTAFLRNQNDNAKINPTQVNITYKENIKKKFPSKAHRIMQVAHFALQRFFI
jgi:hypothetical protein